jgi:hypothetical protein
VCPYDATSPAAPRFPNRQCIGTVGIDGQCPDISGAHYSNGTLIEEWTGNGGANQQWSVP